MRASMATLEDLACRQGAYPMQYFQGRPIENAGKVSISNTQDTSRPFETHARQIQGQALQPARQALFTTAAPTRKLCSLGAP